MKKIFLMVGALSFVFVSYAYAGGYGAAGCGLGSVIFKDNNTMMAQITASTLNGIAFQTSAISCTQSSNCGKSGLVVAQKEQDVFATKNYDSIAKEMAAGSGEHLNTLAALMGYQSEKFAEHTKANYGTIFATNSTNPGEMLRGIRTVMADAG